MPSRSKANGPFLPRWLHSAILTDMSFLTACHGRRDTSRHLMCTAGTRTSLDGACRNTARAVERLQHQQGGIPGLEKDGRGSRMRPDCCWPARLPRRGPAPGTWPIWDLLSGKPSRCHCCNCVSRTTAGIRTSACCAGWGSTARQYDISELQSTPLIQIPRWSSVPLLLLDKSPVLAGDMCVRRWCSG